MPQGIWGPKSQIPLCFLLHDHYDNSPSQKSDDSFVEGAWTETNLSDLWVQGAKYPLNTKYKLLVLQTSSYYLQFISSSLFHTRSSLQCKSDPAQLWRLTLQSRVFWHENIFLHSNQQNNLRGASSRHSNCCNRVAQYEMKNHAISFSIQLGRFN